MASGVLRTLAALGCGIVFGLGLAISGMMNPAKVIGFLDVAGDWDPTLALVMGGALLVAIPAYRVILKRRRPLGRFFPACRGEARRAPDLGLGPLRRGLGPRGLLPRSRGRRYRNGTSCGARVRRCHDRRLGTTRLVLR
jgi:hypothetical protein